MYKTENISKIYPEFYIIKVNDFNVVAENSLDEWINFLKTEKIRPNTTAKGLKEASETLKILKLTEEERKEYDRYLFDCSDNYELLYDNYKRGRLEGELEGKIEGIKEGILEGKIEGKIVGILEGKLEMAKKCKQKGMDTSTIAELTGLTAD